VSGGVLPDLRYATEWTFKNWESIVLDGLYKNRGMVPFDDVIDATDAQAIKSYVIHRAHQTLQELEQRNKGETK
jgi:hypothetical protein